MGQDMKAFSGGVAVITGAGSGIGEGLARLAAVTHETFGDVTLLVNTGCSAISSTLCTSLTAISLGKLQ